MENLLLILYLLVAYIVFYFLCKKSETDVNIISNIPLKPEFIMISMGWIITLPLYFIWKLLDRITKKK